MGLKEGRESSRTEKLGLNSLEEMMTDFYPHRPVEAGEQEMAVQAGRWDRVGKTSEDHL